MDVAMHIHLDAIGGIAGDMFVAALLDAFPDRTDDVLHSVRLAGLGSDVVTRLLDHNDGVLVGKRFDVHKERQSDLRSQPHEHGHEGHAHDHGHRHVHHDAHDHDHGHVHHDHSHHHHNHTHWAHLRAQLQGSALADGIKRHAIGIFSELAWAEAKVHGKNIDDVTFHEVGNWDSIADIVAAATLIESLGAASWSVASLPMGQGRVKTAHGELPVPAPATALLLEGFAVHHDGRPGERVTPTGAAILRYLKPAQGIGTTPQTLHSSGHGFGTRKLHSMSNLLRVLAFESATSTETDSVGIIQFEIDDQTGEELAVALDHIRATPGVIDATQGMTTGKKGRVMASIQVLVRPERMDEAVSACFRQTTTLGVRTRVETRIILSRREVEAGGLRVKIADRPGGPTAKAESDDVASDPTGHRSRSAERLQAEHAALKGTKHDH